MTDKNTTNETTTTPGTELPPVPNGASNGTAPHGAAATAEATPTTSQAPSKKKKKRDAHAQRMAIATIDPAAVPTTSSVPPQSSEPAVQDTAVGPSTPGQPVPPEAPAASATSASPAAPAPIEPPPVAPAAAAPAPPAAAPVGETAAKGLRLRMKIWTDARTNKRYLVPSAFMRDVVDGHPVSDVMYAYAISGDEILHITLRANEWQMLPFAFFQEEGPA